MRRVGAAAACVLLGGCLTQTNPRWDQDAQDDGASSSSTTAAASPTATATSATSAGGSSSSGGGSGPTSSGTSGDNPATTGAPLVPPCDGETVVFETFADDLDEARWRTVIGGDAIELETSDGLLYARVDADDEMVNSAFASLRWQGEQVKRGQFGVEVITPPPNLSQDRVSQLILSIQDPDQGAAYIEIINDSLLVTRQNGPGQYATITSTTYDVVMHRWLRFGFDRDADLFGVETSPDGQQWTTLLPPEVFNGVDFDIAQVRLTIGTFATEFVGDLVVVDNLFLCDLDG